MNQKKEIVNYKTRGGGNTSSRNRTSNSSSAYILAPVTAQTKKEKLAEENKLSEDIKDNFGVFIADIPDYPFCIVVSKWTTPENSPLFNDLLAIRAINKCGYFPLGWNLDEDLYPLLIKRPALVAKLSLELAKDAGAIRKNIKGREKEGERSLVNAASDNKLECIKGLLAAGVDINAKYSESTPLHAAVDHKQTECVRLLLATPGVDVNAKNKRGDTPLHIATTWGRTEYVKLLLAAPGVDVNAKDNFNMTPLHVAVNWERSECLQILLATAGVEVNIKSTFGGTPLHSAAKNGCTECVRQLLAAQDIDVNAKNDILLQTPLYWAARSGHRGCVELLLAVPGIEVDNDMVDAAKTRKIKNLLNSKLETISSQTTQGGKPKPTKQNVIYAGKKYVVRMGAKGGKYILVGSEKKKVYV